MRYMENSENLFNKNQNGEDDESRKEFERALEGLTNLPTRDENAVREAVAKAKTVTKIKEVMETGWPNDPRGGYTTSADREGYEKWDKLSLEALKEAETMED